MTETDVELLYCPITSLLCCAISSAVYFDWWVVHNRRAHVEQCPLGAPIGHLHVFNGPLECPIVIPRLRDCIWLVASIYDFTTPVRFRLLTYVSCFGLFTQVHPMLIDPWMTSLSWVNMQYISFTYFWKCLLGNIFLNASPPHPSPTSKVAFPS